MNIFKKNLKVVESGGKVWVQNHKNSKTYTELNEKQAPKRDKTFLDGSVEDAVKTIFGG